MLKEADICLGEDSFSQVRKMEVDCVFGELE